MSSHLAFQRGRALALLALLFSAVGPTWAACNGNPAAKFDPTNGQTVPERSGGNPTTVTLDGSKSTPGNNDLVFQWTYTGSTPSGLSVTLSNPAAQKPTFVAPSVGPAGATLNFSLKVTCGNQSDTQTTTVNVTDVFTNAAPVASAFISPLNANEGQTVTLDGSASSDPDGQAITYAWTQISGSPTVTLANVSANGAVKSFVAPNLPVTATLGFRLTVSDGSLTGSTDKTVSIVFNNDPPLAALNCPVGGVLTVDEGASVNFSSAGSSDPEGGALTYAWSQGIGLPNLNIGGTTTPALSFTAPHLGYQQLGGTSITLTVTDALNASVSKTCGLFITDVTAPVIIVPYDITAEATSAAGASVSYSVTSQDAVEDLLPAPLACVPPSSSIFPLDATTIVACTDEDANHNVANASFTITVQDKTPPILAVPGDTAVQATSAAGAVGNFTATKTDLVDGGPSPATCVPATGSTFAFGDTTVTCSAVDTHGNAALDQTFVLTVMDTIAPTIDPHGDLADVEATSSAGAVVTYDAPATHDAVDGDGVADCEPPSGDTFPLGPTTITCGKTDAHGNVATPVSFGVKVVDTTAPVIAARGTETAEATSAAGALVTYTAPTWTDAVDGSGGANCLPASGTNFALGTTTVHCNKTDFAGNAALETTFDVEVVDTTPPVVEVNDDIDGVEATGPSGAVVTYLSPATHDLVDGDGVATCTPASGSTFGLGPNLVTCNAEDAHHNHAIATTFVIEVVDTTAPVLSLPSSITEEATGPSGAAVSFSPSASDIVSGNVAVTCAPLSGSTFGLGSTTVNCSAQDGAGNTATGSFTVTVQDTTAPVIAWHADVSAISLANSKAIVTYTPPTAQDLVDGAVTVSCSPASGSEFGMGSTEVKCSAQDATGNKAGSSFHVNVSYNFGGFLRPIDNVPTVNVVKAGQAIPVKFSLGGNQGLGIFATGYPKVIVTGCTGTLLDAIEETVTAGNSSLQYDAGAGQYIYVWKTDKAWAATCRQLVVKFVDGSTQVANFNFTR